MDIKNMEAVIDEQRLKVGLNAVFSDVFQEQRGLGTEAVHAAMEDLGLARSIEEGRRTPLVSRERIFQLLGETA